MARYRSVLILFATFLGCSSPKPIPLEVEYAGCKAVIVPGPLCVLGEERKLSLWVGAPADAEIEVRVDGERVGEKGESFSLILPAQAKRLEVLAASEEGRASWSLSFTKEEDGDDLLGGVDAKTSRAFELIQDRDLVAARTLLAGIRLPPGAPAESRYLMSYYKAMFAHREGDYRTTLTEHRRAAKIAERVKLDEWRLLAEQALALALQDIGRSREAALLYEKLRRAPYSWGSCREAQLLSNQGWSMLLARDTGENLPDPAPILEKALAMYSACKQDTVEKRANILLNLAFCHLQEGRLALARERLVQAKRLTPDAPLLHTLWRLDLEARIKLMEGRPAEALRRLDDLEAIALTTSSPDGLLRSAFLKAKSHRALGSSAAALEILRRAEDLLDEQSLQIPIHEGRETFAATRQAIVGLHLDILLDQRQNREALDVARRARSRLLRQLERRDRLATLTPEQRETWERHLAAYQQKRAELDERARDEWKWPVDRRPREQAAMQEELEELKNILDEALLALESPGERDREKPPPPGDGELILAFHPLSRGWAGFADDGKKVLTSRFDLPPGLSPAEQAERLLVPFRDSIARAGKIRILGSGPLQEIDFHALPFGGDVLLAKAPVVYGLDLPVSATSIPPQRPRALLVADPHGDLPGTLDEAGKVLRVLKSMSRPWDIEELKGEAASAKAVRERLARADLFHYAGHGTFSGFGGWDSSLLLADETRLTLGDLLALGGRVPVWAVLSACDAGRSSTDVPVESLGLAQAFLIAGSRAVVASVRPADDRKLPAFFPELYREWDREPELAVALQRAQLSWRKRNPEADWEAFRLFEP